MISRMSEFLRTKFETVQEAFRIVIPNICNLEITCVKGKGYIIKPLSNEYHNVCLYNQFDPNNPLKYIVFDLLTHSSCTVERLSRQYTVVERYHRRDDDPQVSFREIGTIDVESRIFTPASSPKEAKHPE